MTTKKTYRQLQEELDVLLEQLQSAELDIDKAIILHNEAERLIVQLEDYLAEAKNEIKHLKSK